MSEELEILQEKLKRYQTKVQEISDEIHNHPIKKNKRLKDVNKIMQKFDEIDLNVLKITNYNYTEKIDSTKDYRPDSLHIQEIFCKKYKLTLQFYTFCCHDESEITITFSYKNFELKLSDPEWSESIEFIDSIKENFKDTPFRQQVINVIRLYCENPYSFLPTFN